jgi:hypothetical protein
MEYIELISRIKAAYRSEELRPVNKDALLTAGIEALDVEFLSTIGVPRVEQLQIAFNLIDRLPSLKQFAADTRYASAKSPFDFICLNEKYGIVLGVDKQRDGNVMSLDLEDKLPVRFVNSRVRYMVGFMAECVLHWRRWTTESIPKETSLNMACEWMQSVDVSALQPDTWWSLVLEQMHTGL